MHGAAFNVLIDETDITNGSRDLARSATFGCGMEGPL